jgi:two-component system phosphate regulon sensor histidine kinase PhoR
VTGLEIQRKLAGMDDPIQQPRSTVIGPEDLGIGELFYRIRDAVIVGDAESGRVVLWNHAATEIFGYEVDEALGILIEDLVPSSLKQAHRNGLAHFAGTGHGSLIDSSQILELPAIRKDGTEITVELSLTPLRSEQLPGRFAMAIVRDATARKQSEDMMREAAEREREAADRLRDIDDLRNLFLATLAHDVRSPLAAVIGFAGTIRDHFAQLKEDEVRQIADAMNRSANTALRLIEQIVDVAALESGQLSVEPVLLHIRPTLERAVQEAQAQNPGLTITIDAPTELPPIEADPDRMWQIVSNLLSNAARFSPEGGRIEVRISADETSVVVTVKDEGPGIAEEDRDRLFEKFARGARTRGYGAGLGLYICKMLIDAQKGRLWLEPSTEGEGATFSFSLPIANSTP